MPMYNLTEYTNNYKRTSESLCQNCKNDPNNNMADSESFKFKSRHNNNTNNVRVANVEIAVSLIYSSIFGGLSKCH